MTPSDSREPLASGPTAREQVILPWAVAVRITLRGLRIRLGRSLVTVSGVVLGIAFLMAVMTGEGLRAGLAAETRTRTEVARLVKLVEEEIGAYPGRKLAVLISGPVTDRHHLRLLEKIAAKADAGAVWVLQTRPDRLEPVPAAELQPALRGPAFTAGRDLDAMLRDAHVLLLLQPDLPRLDAATLVGLLERMRQPVLLDSVPGRYLEPELRQLNPKAVCTSLTYQMSEAEQQRADRRAAQARARTAWITIVAMLVTVIGIANAMLMSVTERIREIGTMKCLGALSGFVVKLFLIESFLIGSVGAVLGTLIGFVVPFVAYVLSAGVGLVLESTPFARLLLCAGESALAGIVLSILAAIYPARVAARMVPADALRTNV